jgi:hypothetical protein
MSKFRVDIKSANSEAEQGTAPNAEETDLK